MLNLKRWERVVHEETGLAFEVKRLNYAETAALKSLLSRAHAEFVAASAAAPAERGDALWRAYQLLDPAKVRPFMEANVRNVELMLDGEPATTGGDLHDLADASLIMFALTKLQEHASLPEAAGKASPSHSISDGAAGEISSGPPALSIVHGAGPDTSTATETSTDPESSSAVA